jgi:acyl-CoA synthetase (AMP-forming)/AMP-acid ligase II
MFNIGHILEHNARRFASQIALLSLDKSLTYRQLNQKVDSLALGLKSLGLNSGSICSLLLYNSFEFIEAYFAISKLGAITNAINYRLSKTEIAYILDSAKPNVLIIDRDFLDKLHDSVLSKNSELRIIVVDDNEKATRTTSKETPPLTYYGDLILAHNTKQYLSKGRINDNNLLIYTSGTTGFPKGALITNSHVIWNSFNTLMFFGFTKEDVTLAISPFFHIAGLHNLVFPHLHLGGTVAILKKFDPELTLKAARKYKVTNFFLVPSMYQMLLENWPSTSFKLPNSVRMILSGAAPMPQSLFDEITTTIHSNLFYGYGMTEVGPNVCFSNSVKHPNKKGTIGQPLPHQMVTLLKDDLSETSSPLEVGEIAIDGPTVFNGYLNDQESTKKTKVNIKINGIKRNWLLTGDMAYCDKDNFYYIVDRKKDMIISGGENIYCLEVESVITSHPDVQESAIIGVHSKKWGEIVKALIVPKKNKEISFKDLETHCRKKLGGYKIPKKWEIVKPLPRNASGKLIRTLLKEESIDRAGE